MKNKDISLEEGFRKLEELVEEFESNEIDLEKAIPKFKDGLELGKLLKVKLSRLENEIKEIQQKDNEP